MYFFIFFYFRETFSKKLGFDESHPNLVEMFLTIFKETKADLTMVFRELSETPLSLLLKPTVNLWALKIFSKHKDYIPFIEKYKEELLKSGNVFI